MKLYGDNDFVSPGSIGGKIKKYRELRGLTQKELGIRCGYSASSADVRIAQYEKNKKIPRESALKAITSALGISECALFDADLLSYDRMCQALFDIEDLHGLHPVKIGNNYYLEFSGRTLLDQNVLKSDFEDFLRDWYEMRQKFQPDLYDTADEIASKDKEYAIWRAEYPKNVSEKRFEKMQDALRERQLQAELDELFAKKNSDSELARIDAAIESFMPIVKASYSPIEKESDLIYLIKDCIQKGLPVEHLAPHEQVKRDIESRHLFSIKTDEIMSNDTNKKLYARLVYAVETLKFYGIGITRSITAKEKELFVAYRYPSAQHICFDNFELSWKDILNINERRFLWSKDELDKHEEELRSIITGKNDVFFSSQGQCK